MNKIKTFRIRIAILLIAAIVLQSATPVYGAEIRVSDTVEAVSSNTGSKNDITKATSSNSSHESPDKDTETDRPEETSSVREINISEPEGSSKSTVITKTTPTQASTPDVNKDSSTTKVSPSPTSAPKATPATVTASGKLEDKEDRAAGGGSKFSLKSVGTGLRGLLRSNNPQDTDWQNDYEYEFSTSPANYIVLKKYIGSAENITIPAEAVSGGNIYAPVFSDNYTDVFKDKANIKSVDLRSVNTSQLTKMDSMFEGCTSLNSVSMGNINTVKSTQNMFKGCEYITDPELAKILNVLNTSNVINMSGMFSGCKGLVSPDLGSLRTVSASNVSNLFSGCENLKTLDLSNLDTGKIEDMSSMFSGCSELTDLNLSGLDVKKIANMSHMFYGCNKLTDIDLSGFDCTNVTTAQDIFAGCTGLNTIKIPKNLSAAAALPDTFVKKTDTGISYTAIPNEANSFTIVRGSAYVHVSGNVISGNRVSGNKITIYVGEPSDVYSYITPENATNKNVTWNVANESVVSLVSNNGTATLTGLKEGQTSISSTTEDNHYVSSCSIEVINNPYKVASVSLNEHNINIGIGILRTRTLTATVNPDTATDRTVTWRSDNTDIATVSNGKVTGVAEGKTKIWVKTNDGGKEDSCSVNVIKNKITDITVDPHSRYLDIGDDFTLSVNITPDDASVKTLTFTSSDTNKATVDSTGKVSGIAAGNVNITVSANDGSGKYDTCTVTVQAVPVTGIKLNKQDLRLLSDGRSGETYQLVATVSPNNATVKKVIWSSRGVSGNNNVVSVDQDGNVRAKEIGWAVVTAEAQDRSSGKIVSTSCNVIVDRKIVSVNDISLYPPLHDIKIGDSVALRYEIDPSDATDKRVEWFSSDPATATVNDGIVTGVSANTATITVRTVDGGKEARCTVRVTERPHEVEEIILEKETEWVYVGQEKKINVKDILPHNASDKTITWSSNNPSVATVSNKGVVKGIGVGKEPVIITAEATNHVRAICLVSVIPLPVSVTGIFVTPVQKELYVGQGFNINATVTPADATVKTITWTSTNDNVATVDGSGRVVAKSKGEATITATTVDGGYKAECKVKVTEAPPGPSPSPTPTPTPTPGLYMLHVVDVRGNNAPHKDKVKAAVEKLGGNRYLIITDSNGDKLKPRIKGDSSLDHHKAVYMDIRIVDDSGKDVNDFGKCTIRIPLISDMDLHNGTVKVVAQNGDGIDKSIASSTGSEGDVDYVTFTASHFCEYAILYKLNQSVIDYYNRGYYSLPTQILPGMNAMGQLNNQTRVLDYIPRTGTRLFKKWKRRR